MGSRVTRCRLLFTAPSPSTITMFSPAGAGAGSCAWAGEAEYCQKMAQAKPIARDFIVYCTALYFKRIRKKLRIPPDQSNFHAHLETIEVQEAESEWPASSGIANP